MRATIFGDYDRWKVRQKVTIVDLRSLYVGAYKVVELC